MMGSSADVQLLHETQVTQGMGLPLGELVPQMLLGALGLLHA